MLAILLREKSVSFKLTINLVLSVVFIALSVVLPLICHLAFGSRVSTYLLPMYFPIILGGLFLGFKYGIFLGIIAPLISFLLTSLTNNPMPALSRLPYMMVELALFGLISGLFSKKSYQKPFFAFVGTLISSVIARSVFLLLAYLFNYQFNIILEQVLSSITIILVYSIFSFIIAFIFKKLVKNNG